MAIKKSDLYSSIWASCDELRGGMDASQYKDYVLFMLFIKYVSDKYGNSPPTKTEQRAIAETLSDVDGLLRGLGRLIETDHLRENLKARGYSGAHISGALQKLLAAADPTGIPLYQANLRVYKLLRYGVEVQVAAGQPYDTVHLIDWERPDANDFAPAEEVTLKGRLRAPARQASKSVTGARSLSKASRSNAGVASQSSTPPTWEARTGFVLGLRGHDAASGSGIPQIGVDRYGPAGGRQGSDR